MKALSYSTKKDANKMKISVFPRKLLTKTALIQALRLSQANIISSEQSIFAKKTA
jgi:hypothetical protein